MSHGDVCETEAQGHCCGEVGWLDETSSDVRCAQAGEKTQEEQRFPSREMSDFISGKVVSASQSIV